MYALAADAKRIACRFYPGTEPADNVERRLIIVLMAGVMDDRHPACQQGRCAGTLHGAFGGRGIEAAF